MIRNRCWIQEVTEGCSRLQGYSLYRYNKTQKDVPSSFFGKQLAQWPQLISQASVICRFYLVIAYFCCARLTGAHHVVHQVCAHPAIRSMIYIQYESILYYYTIRIGSTIASHAVLFSLPSHCQVVATSCVAAQHFTPQSNLLSQLAITFEVHVNLIWHLFERSRTESNRMFSKEGLNCREGRIGHVTPEAFRSFWGHYNCVVVW